MREYSAAAALARYPVTVPSSPGYGVSEPRFDSTMYAPLSIANATEPPIPCEHRTAERVLGTRHGEDRLEEATPVLLLGREVVGEAEIGALEAAVDVAVAYRLVPPLVGVDVRLV